LRKQNDYGTDTIIRQSRDIDNGLFKTLIRVHNNSQPHGRHARTCTPAAVGLHVQRAATAGVCLLIVAARIAGQRSDGPHTHSGLAADSNQQSTFSAAHCQAHASVRLKQTFNPMFVEQQQAFMQTQYMLPPLW
jgi:hypothetical protein